MKRIIALLLCLCMAFSLAACSGSTVTPPATDPGTSASGGKDPADGSADPGAASDASLSAGTESPAPEVVTGEPNVALEKITDSVMDKDGTVLVNYEYQKATVTLPDAEAQVAVQQDLDAELQIFLDYVSGELTGYARDTLSYVQEETTSAAPADSTSGSASASDSTAFQPYDAQYILTVKRADKAVVSIVVDSVSYSGGAHGSDTRYCLNYDAKTGKRLTFDMLGKGFRQRSEEVVLSKLEGVKDQLDEGYEAQLPLVVCDGTESLDEVNRKVYPDLYADASIEPETGNLDAKFYLNDKGVMFVVGEYVMKPYAGGILEIGFLYKTYGENINQEYVVKSAKNKKKSGKQEQQESSEKTEEDAEAAQEDEEE